MEKETMDSARSQDINGYVTIDNNPISRVGVFPYLGSQIGAPEPDRVYNVFRPPETLSEDEAIQSFKNVPIIDDHTMLGPAEDGMTPAEKKGIHGVVTESVAYRDGVLYGNLKIFSETLKRLIESGKKELSLAYRCIYDKMDGTFGGQSYQYVQKAMRGNHLALVDRARCDVAVLDSQNFTMDSFDLNLKGDSMTEEEKKLQQESMDAAIKSAVAAAIKPVADSVAALDAKISTLSAGDAAKAKDEDAAKADGEEEEAEEEAPAADKKAMDSLAAEIAELKKNGVKAMMGEVKARDALAHKLSAHVGTFDHLEMTVEEVAKYGCEKLGLKVQAGSERIALDGFLHQRPDPAKGSTFKTASDSAVGGSEKLSKFIK